MLVSILHINNEQLQLKLRKNYYVHQHQNFQRHQCNKMSKIIEENYDIVK